MGRYDHYEMLSVTNEDRILTITLERPDQLNAVNTRLHTELSRVFADAKADPEADVVVLTGRGRAFSAGGDLDWMDHAIENPESFEEVAREAKDIVFSQLDLDKPLICKMNGHAIGLGASLACLCDIVVAADTAKIGDPHVSVGLVAGDGGALIWPQLCGYTKARYYLFTGEAMTAAEAERIGLVSQVVPAAELDATVDALARKIAKGPLKAIRWTKITTNLPLKAIFHSHFDAGLAYELMSNRTADHREAVSAFREKREPVFTGR